ncbi:MAG: hypothetical protein ABEI99_12275, partial [Halobaculum sp.]
MTDSNVPGQGGGTATGERGPSGASGGRARPDESEAGTVIESAVAGRAEPVALSTDVSVTDGVALVTCRIRNRTPVPRGVRVTDRLDGP